MEPQIQKQPVQPAKTWNKQFMKVYYWTLLAVGVITIVVGLIMGRDYCTVASEYSFSYCGTDGMIPWANVMADSIENAFLMVAMSSILFSVAAAILRKFKKISKLNNPFFVLIPIILIILWLIRKSILG